MTVAAADLSPGHRAYAVLLDDPRRRPAVANYTFVITLSQGVDPLGFGQSYRRTGDGEHDEDQAQDQYNGPQAND
jgi:hypothetical protein